MTTAEITAARVHFLKCWPTFFDAIVRGEKKAELRQDDGRGFRVGDVLRLRRLCEDHPQSEPSGESVDVRVTHIVPGNKFGLYKGFVMMSIEIVDMGGVA